MTISSHVKVSEPHVNTFQQLHTQTHIHACHYTWEAAAICFRVEFIVDICTMLGVVHKYGNPFINGYCDLKYR
jgi:hypothetical protein